MTNPDSGLSTGSDPALLAGFLTGEIQRDYMGSVREVEDAVGLDLKGQPKKKKDEISAGAACTCDTTNCRNTCVTPDATQTPQCKPPKGPTKRASW